MENDKPIVTDRIEERMQIAQYLDSASQSATNLLVIGSYGLGKTTCMRYCLCEWREEKVRRVYLHCFSIPENAHIKYILDLVVEDLRPRYTTKSTEDAKRVIIEEIERSPLLVIFDEIKGKYANPVLNILARLNQDVKQGHISVAIVCNDMTVYQDLKPDVKSAAQPQTLYFKQYTRTELVRIGRIISKKLSVEISSFDLTETAEFVETMKGDVRILEKILKRYRMTGNLNEAFRDYVTASSPLANMLSILPKEVQVTLYCIIEAVKDKGKTNFQDLYNGYKNSTTKAIRETPISLRSFYRHVDYLHEQNLVFLEKGKKGKGLRANIFLNDSLGRDIDIAFKILNGLLG